MDKGKTSKLHCEMIWKIWKKTNLKVKRYEKYGRHAS